MTPDSANIHRIPKRKVSVFSHDGFPALQLLDRHHSLQQQPAANGGQPVAVVATAAAAAANSSNKTVANSQNVHLDALGSTGSSRASSCDEPNTGLVVPQKEAVINMDSSSSSLDSLGVSQQDSSNSSSNSDTKTAVNEEQQMEAVETTGGAELEAHKRQQVEEIGEKSLAKKQSTRAAPPFESIKVQLKRNSMPNAQTIQRHIENLISQNEAIVDNWNFVSIRSYSSSRSQDSSQANGKPGEPSLGRVAAKQQRWSTAMLNSPVGSGSTGVSAASQQQHHHLRLPGDNTATSVIQTPVPRDQSRRLAERKRSYNVAKRPIFFQQQPLSKGSPLLSPNQQVEPRKDAAVSSFGGSSTKVATFEPSDHNHAHQELQQQLELQKYMHQQAPVDTSSVYCRLRQDSGLQLESAIQNLSLRREQDGEFRHFFDAFPETITGCAEMAAHMTPLAGFQKSSQLGPGDSFHHQHHHQVHQHKNNQPVDLILNQYQHDEQMVLAALLMERQRQAQVASLASAASDRHQSALEEQSAILRQQQHMIEQQLDQIRRGDRMAANEQQQMASLLASSFNHHQQHDEHQQQQQSNYLLEQQAIESQLLKDFLTKMMPVNLQEVHTGGGGIGENLYHKQAPRLSGGLETRGIQLNLEHGSELLTQSMDSAKPLHRCEACDISFWTRDLLNYHMLTQCVAANKPVPPLTFKFTGPNNYDHQINDEIHPYGEQRSHLLLEQPHKLLSKSVSPPKRLLEAESINQLQQEQQVAIESQADVVGECVEASHMTSGRLSILKHQLLANQMVPHESLPFKKRKISEPTMCYSKQSNQLLEQQHRQ